MEGSAARYDVRLGDVSRSQVVIGDHTNVFTPEGVKVVKIVSADERPEPRPRPAPVLDRPDPPATLVGREEELRACAEASSRSPLQLHGPDGAGKTTLLKRVANTASVPPGGAVFLRARRRSLDDVESMLFDEFWEADVRFVPGPGELPRYLAGRRALVVIDDLDIDRDDLDALHDAIGDCTLVIGSSQCTLWDCGRALALRGLDENAGAELIGRVTGRSLTGDELEAARRVSHALEGLPQSLVEVAAAVREGLATLAEIAATPDRVAARVPDGALSDSQRRILAALAAVPGTALGPGALARVADAADAERDAEGLRRLGLVRSDSPRYRVEPAVARGVDAMGDAELARGLRAWVDEQADPRAVAAESEAIEATLELGVHRERREEVVGLALAAEAKLALAGLVGGWGRALAYGFAAARAAGDEATEAYMLHQLGSRALSLGAADAAVEHLGQALAIRERIGDTRGAELTRSNLGQLGGPSGGNGRGPRPRPPRAWLIAAAVLLVLAAGAGLALALGGGSSEQAAPVSDRGPSATSDGGGKHGPEGTGPTPTDHQAPPRVVIESPPDGAVEGEVVQAVFSCPGAVECVGKVDGTEYHSGAYVPLTETERTLTVTATAEDGQMAHGEHTYHSADPESPTGP